MKQRKTTRASRAAAEAASEAPPVKTLPEAKDSFATALAKSVKSSRTGWTWPKGSVANIESVRKQNDAGLHSHVPLQTLARKLREHYSMPQSVATIIRRIKLSYPGGW